MYSGLSLKVLAPPEASCSEISGSVRPAQLPVSRRNESLKKRKKGTMANFTATAGFHDAVVASVAGSILAGHWDMQFKYTFENFFHPFVGELISKLNRDSLSGMLDAKWQDGLRKDFFEALYHPTNDKQVQVESFPKEIEVEEHQA